MARNRYHEMRKEMMEILGDRETIQAADVVEYARQHKNSAIREAFDKHALFNDKAAANQARLYFAQSLIRRVRVKLHVPDRPPTNHRVFVNLIEERKTEYSGYRLRTQVLTEEERREKFRRDCAVDIVGIAKKYSDILSDEQIDALHNLAAEVAEPVEVG